MSRFSSNEIDVIERKEEIDVNVTRTWQDINDYYELDRCTEWIKDQKLSKVCLQFPDHMLHDSVDVALIIESKVGFQPYILGDTSYGSCCVDVVAAQHVGADGIIHFGHACLSPTGDLPLLYIFEKLPIDTNHFISSFRKMFADRDEKILLFYEVEYQHAIDAVLNDISSYYSNVVVTTLVTSSANGEKSKILGRDYRLPESSSLEDYSITFIGRDGPVLFNILVTLPSKTFYVYDPSGDRQLKLCTRTSSKFLMKRMYLVERVKDARTLGILVGTLAISNCLDAVNRIKQLAKLRGKKCYVISVGKPNVAKLANFPEVEVFVFVVCPENSLIDSKEFFQPIVTPYEVELACNPNRTWSEQYILEFQRLLSGGTDYEEIDENSVDDAGDVSLVSGRLRSLEVTDTCQASHQIAVKSDGTVSTVQSTGSQFLSERSWQGLQVKLGEHAPAEVTEGRSGIPTGYNTDHNTLDN